MAVLPFRALALLANLPLVGTVRVDETLLVASGVASNSVSVATVRLLRMQWLIPQACVDARTEPGQRWLPLTGAFGVQKG